MRLFSQAISTSLALLIVVLAGLLAGFLMLWQYGEFMREVKAPLPILLTQKPITLAIPDLTTWRTYRNEKYGFEVGYPSGILVQPVSSNSAYIDFLRKTVVSGTEPPILEQYLLSRKDNFENLVSIDIYFKRALKQLTLDTDYYFCASQFHLNNVLENELLLINDIPMLHRKASTESAKVTPEKIDHYYCFKSPDDYLFRFVFSDENQELARSILSTFRFASNEKTRGLAFWNDRILEVRDLLWQEESFSDILVHYPLSFKVSEIADLTGDKNPEAVLYLAPRGAATSYYTLLRIKAGKATLMHYRKQDGSISPVLLVGGGGGAGRYGYESKMWPEKRAIYNGNHSAYGNEDDVCNAEAYKWDLAKEIFEYNSELSQQAQIEYCKSICQTYGSLILSDTFLRQYCDLQ